MLDFPYPEEIDYLCIRNTPEVWAKLLELGYICVPNNTPLHYTRQYLTVAKGINRIYQSSSIGSTQYTNKLDITEWFTKKYLENNNRKAFKLMRTLR